MSRHLTKDDIAFLKDLQHELRTQDYCGTADPRYWHILEKKMVRTFEGNGEEGILNFDGDVFFGADITEKLVNEISSLMLEAELNQYLYDTDFENEDFSYQFLLAKGLWDKHKRESFPYELGYFTDEYKVAYPLFLTQKECEEHIKRYRYNYSDPQSYCIYSDRTPTLEKLLEILENVDFDTLEVVHESKS